MGSLPLPVGPPVPPSAVGAREVFRGSDVLFVAVPGRAVNAPSAKITGVARFRRRT
jgi:hypothetical protein